MMIVFVLFLLIFMPLYSFPTKINLKHRSEHGEALTRSHPLFKHKKLEKFTFSQIIEILWCPDYQR